MRGSQVIRAHAASRGMRVILATQKMIKGLEECLVDTHSRGVPSHGTKCSPWLNALTGYDLQVSDYLTARLCHNFCRTLLGTIVSVV
jgi:hypothetical protein